MTAEVLSSNAVTNLDAQPIVVPTSGEGACGDSMGQQDQVAHTSAFGSALKNSSRQSRFPMAAKVKHVYIYTKGLDSNASATLTLDINVAFSDSTTDGTQSAAQGNIPASSLDGAITTPSTYSSANKMFGSGYACSNSGAVKYTEVTYSNTYTPAFALQPMWAVLGGTGAATAAPYTAGGGFNQQSTGQKDAPPGFWDMLVVVAATAATAATGNIGTEVDYVM
jgi:hypothetical protein